MKFKVGDLVRLLDTAMVVPAHEKAKGHIFTIFYIKKNINGEIYTLNELCICCNKHFIDPHYDLKVCSNEIELSKETNKYNYILRKYGIRK